MVIAGLIITIFYEKIEIIIICKIPTSKLKNGSFEHLAKYIIFALNEKDFGQPQIFQARKTSLGHVCIQTREIGLT